MFTKERAEEIKDTLNELYWGDNDPEDLIYSFTKVGDGFVVVCLTEDLGYWECASEAICTEEEFEKERKELEDKE